MSKKHVKEEYQTEEVFQNLDEFAHKTENFFEKNAKFFAIGFGVLVVGALLYFLYLQYVVKPKNTEAMTQLVEVQKDFQADSLDKVLGNEVAGAAYLANEKGGTQAGKIAAVYAGNAEFKKGNFQKALEYFQKFDSSDEIANAMVQVSIGDCYVELNENEKAMSQFEKAISMTDNGGTQFTAVKKAVILGLETKQEAKAKELLQTFKDQHPDVDNSGFVDAYLERL